MTNRSRNERLTDEQRRIKELEKELKDRELDLKILKNAIFFVIYVFS
ncbi:MAG: hypothetical protein RSD84_06935 [Bacteroidales bacterium]